MATSKTTPSHPALPNELLHAIFAHISKRDLIKLAKSHRVFQNSARRHLLSHLEVPAQSTLAKPFVAQHGYRNGPEEDYTPSDAPQSTRVYTLKPRAAAT
ncbi:hypothetical protein P3342_001619 [Pyrenophora teres f. teres]|uniref:F-box domain containing protein n=1 Tax=Pyrenophora teres f. teres TaxID=97479 RepID=A0A6S6VVA0_9PLEO|nr:hypothetical protein HRS9139_09907 [Pyrenophora teres f. teres]KAE8826302.1 hypothetical protein PTNB85_09247 [Pyrenophora teres f. teres]KAE8852638.1 hypothetical protein PTNB29_10028 [Pyrenophora teres f. teres]KAK1917037.1 hypothetical protein P3342_001619 [Pyrenophora teres f. teres]CAE7002552.1 F-box domain containing protein [Pyrenophora teres f. teres]